MSREVRIRVDEADRPTRVCWTVLVSVPLPDWAGTTIAAPPEVVFPYFTDPALIVTWMGDRADLDPQPGGIFAVDVGTSPARGSYVAVEPPTRLVFTWGLPGSQTMPAGSTTVEVILTADGDETIVSLTHHDLPDEHRPGHKKGWDTFLGALPAAVVHH